MIYKIDGTLRLTAPYHSSIPGKAYYNPDTRQFSRDVASEAFPCTRTNRLPFIPFSNGGDSDESDGERGATAGRSGAVNLPVIAANSLRGALRRIAAGLVYEILIARGEVLSLETYYAMQTGASSGQPESSRVFYLNKERESSAHPFLGQFGGGPQMKESKLRIAYGWPVLPMTQAGGLVPENIEVGVSDKQRLTDMVCFSHVDDLLRFSDPRAASIIREYPKALTDWIDRVMVNSKQRKEKRKRKDSGSGEEEANGEPQNDVKKLDLRGLYFHEVVVPGVSFYVSFRLDASTCGLPALGLLLHSFASFAEREHIGSWSRNGYGRFKSNLRLGEAGKASQPLFITANDSYELDHAHPLVEPALDAWASFCDKELSAASLESVYRVQSA